MAAAVSVLAFGTALPASAHPTLLSTSPEAGYSVASAPREIALVFDEPVSAGPGAVRIEDDRGDEVRAGALRTEQGGRRLVVGVVDELDAGRYVVRWQVTARDGDVVDANFDFAVATTTTGLRGRDTTSTAAFPLVSILRWLFFLGLAGVVGGLVGERIARRRAPDATEPRSWVRPAAVLGLLAAVGLAIQLIVVTGGFGRAAYLLGFEAVALAAVVAIGQRRIVVLPVALVLVAEAHRNHLGAQRGMVGAVVIAIHLVAITAWVGALVHLIRVALVNRRTGSQLGAAFADYTRMALMLVVLVAASGTIAALLLVPDLAALTSTAYGLTLLAKLTLVAVVVVLAWISRRRLNRSPGVLPRAAQREAVGMTVVLATSAALVSLPTPAPATADIGYPLPVSGPVIRLGTLAGQIGVGLAISENQLEVRLRLPDDGSQTAETKPPDYRVAASVRAGSESPAVVPLRPCGPGCFVGPVRWRSGQSYVDLRADAPGWTGSAAVFPIHWQPVVAPGALGRVRAALLAQRSIRIVETVTSDTSRPAPKPQTVVVSGREFLESDPYGSPPDPEVVQVRGPNGSSVLLFGLPAEGIHVELEIDASSRVIREKLAAPKHLTERTFSYSR